MTGNNEINIPIACKHYVHVSKIIFHRSPRLWRRSQKHHLTSPPSESIKREKKKVRGKFIRLATEIKLIVCQTLMWFFSLLVSFIRWSFENKIPLVTQQKKRFDHLFFASIARCVLGGVAFRENENAKAMTGMKASQQAITCWMRSRILLNRSEITEVHDQTKIFYFCGRSNGAEF